MLDLERTLATRFPAWFEGVRAPWGATLARGLSKLWRLPQINAFLERSAHLEGLAFVDAALGFVRARYVVDHVERERIPQTGRYLIVANHPLGGIDSLALLKLVGDIRPDVRILANDMLGELAGLAPLLLPLRVLGGRPSAESLRAIDVALEEERAVIVFPAGEVSRLTPGGVRDGRWRRGFLHYAERARAPIVPVHVAGRNSLAFYAASAIYKPLGTLLLPREVSAQRLRRIEFRIGAARDPVELLQKARGMSRALADVRRAIAAIGRGREAEAGGVQPIAHARDLRAIRAEIAALERLGETPDGKAILCGRLRGDSTLLAEIARLREHTFRAVGEGTGARSDTDRFDTWYDHIVLWDPVDAEIVGSYRVAPCARVLAERGVAGLYTSTLFELEAPLRGQLAQGMELGRSFVQPRYWGSRALDYLWWGIGAYLRRNPGIRYLFGPVSISAALPVEARELLVAYYSRWFGAGAAQARAHHPFRFAGGGPSFGELDRDESTALLRANLDALGARVPTLYKQYTELCEPGGASFLAFGVDPAFNHSVDGLILIDLDRVKPKKRERYLEARRPKPAAVAA